MNVFFAYRDLMSLRPTDEIGEEALRSLGMGEIAEVTMKIPRNLSRHRMYWVLLNLVWRNLPEENKSAFPSLEIFHNHMKVMAGLCTPYIVRDPITLPNGAYVPVGTIGYIPGSIAFHKMDQAGFEQFFNGVCQIVIDHFLPTVTIDQLRHEVEKLTDRRQGP